MRASGFRYVYGPVASRRLGRSLGVDLVPFKVCTYDCIYCQLGRTTRKTVERREYAPVEAVLEEVSRKLTEAPLPSYIGLAGSGEPTLSSGIGRIIQGIKAMSSIPVAVLTNGSLLWMPEVREALMAADLVIPSLDAGDTGLFAHVNRPHEGVSFDQMVEGLVEFRRSFPGEVWLEVFLLGGVTAIPSEVKKIAALVERISPARTQLNTVTRPPAEDFALAVSRGEMEILAKLIPGAVEIIAETPLVEAAASPAGIVRREEIIAMLDRRPCTIEDLAGSLGLNRIETLKLVDSLTESGVIISKRIGANVYYSRPGRSQQR